MIFGIFPILLVIIIIVIMTSLNVEKNTETKPHASPKDVFMHLLMIGLLYVGTFSFCTLWFSYISYLFPDALNFYYQSISSDILSATATLVVVFPVFLLTSWLLGKDMVAEPEKRELSVRKWLVYLTLFVAAIAIIVDVVTLVYNFLSGETAITFYLKVLVVFLVSGTIFGYYLWEVRRKAGEISRLPKTLAWAVAAVVFGSICYGFFLIGTPAHQRDIRFDTTRVGDLQSIQYQTINYWQKKNVLPTTLADLNDAISGFTTANDPETKLPYEYRVTGPLSFELCATFKAKSVENGVPNRVYPSSPTMMEKGTASNDVWSHEAGRVCFERTIDVAIYSTNKPIPVIVQ